MDGGILSGRRILFAGESWVTHGIHTKGVVSYTGSLYVEGATRMLDALRGQGADVTYVPNHLAPEHFPRSAAELSKYDAVVLSDIAADSLLLEERCLVQGLRTANRLRELCAYVQDGGSLMMVGGYMSFAGIGGSARYGRTPLAAVLPVHIGSYDDRVETPEGVIPEVLAPDHEILAGCGRQWPYLLGYNQLRAKDGTHLLMQVNNDPLLVTWDVGAGRAVAFASDCSPHWGSQDFMAWESYDTFWGRLLHWMTTRPGVLTGSARGRKGQLDG